MFCSAKVLVLITTGTTREHGVQSIWDVFRCLVEQIVQFIVHLMSFYAIANVVMAVEEHMALHTRSL